MCGMSRNSKRNGNDLNYDADEDNKKPAKPTNYHLDKERTRKLYNDDDEDDDSSLTFIL